MIWKSSYKSTIICKSHRAEQFEWSCSNNDKYIYIYMSIFICIFMYVFIYLKLCESISITLTIIFKKYLKNDYAADLLGGKRQRTGKQLGKLGLLTYNLASKMTVIELSVHSDQLRAGTWMKGQPLGNTKINVWPQKVWSCHMRLIKSVRVRVQAFKQRWSNEWVRHQFKCTLQNRRKSRAARVGVALSSLIQSIFLSAFFISSRGITSGVFMHTVCRWIWILTAAPTAALIDIVSVMMYFTANCSNTRHLWANLQWLARAL